MLEKFYPIARLFIPAKYRAYIDLGLMLFRKLDTAEERRDFVAYVGEALGDGNLTVGEWAKIGSRAGILGKLAHQVGEGPS